MTDTPKPSQPPSGGGQKPAATTSSSVTGYLDPLNDAKALDQVVQTGERLTKEIYAFASEDTPPKFPDKPVVELTEDDIKKTLKLPDGATTELNLKDVKDFEFRAWRHSRTVVEARNLDDNSAGFWIKIPILIQASVSELTLKDKDGSTLKDKSGKEIPSKTYLTKLTINKGNGKSYATSRLKTVDISFTSLDAPPGMHKFSITFTPQAHTLSKEEWTLHLEVDDATGVTTVAAGKYFTVVT